MIFGSVTKVFVRYMYAYEDGSGPAMTSIQDLKTAMV